MRNFAGKSCQKTFPDNMKETVPDTVPHNMTANMDVARVPSVTRGSRLCQRLIDAAVGGLDSFAVFRGE